MLRLRKGIYGSYVVEEVESGEVIMIQPDWDFPGVASTFGWSACHGETDGTVTCPVCGSNVSEMIADAIKWLDEHVGDVVDDPGYFN